MTQFQVPPMPAAMCVEEIGLAVMIGTKRSEDVTPEVNLREHVIRMPLPNVIKASQPGFETQKKRYQKSKNGVLVAPQKELLSL